MAFRILFELLSVLISVYNILCIIRILMTWIPQMAYSSFTRFLAKICDPYLNLFRGIKWLKAGAFDFSPALALCILGAAQSLVAGLARGSRFSLTYILSMLVQMTGSIISSIIVFLIILFAVRLIIIAVNHGNWYTGNYMMEQFDRAISPIVLKISKTFSFGRNLTYKTALLISLIVLIVVLILTNILFFYLAAIINSLAINNSVYLDKVEIY